MFQTKSLKIVHTHIHPHSTPSRANTSATPTASTPPKASQAKAPLSIKIVTYNINGAKNKLSTTLFLANQAKIDALLVQEIHYYEDGTHLRVANMAKHRGWTAFVTHDSHHDPRGGAAIFIRNSSENIKLPINTTPAIALEGRAISIGCCIKGVTTTLTSIYLHADPEKRGQHKSKT
eukprot:scaffold7147_cov130-Isochrysis_galbana.AAC.18